MQHVEGIGGIFFRAKDPAALSAWYERHLGITSQDTFWRPAGGPVVFAPFAQDTDYFGRASQQWMLNFRVRDLAALIRQLEAQGIAVETRAEWESELGAFARIHDPEGNPVELWQPAGDDT